MKAQRRRMPSNYRSTNDDIMFFFLYKTESDSTWFSFSANSVMWLMPWMGYKHIHCQYTDDFWLKFEPPDLEFSRHCKPLITPNLPQDVNNRLHTAPLSKCKIKVDSEGNSPLLPVIWQTGLSCQKAPTLPSSGLCEKTHTNTPLTTNVSNLRKV